ncbi:MAG: DUF3048 domain-containing protein [Clostridia bacterium]|nr:DUF3048 domain-containing protein [Clostridia bacterium]
MLKKLSLILLCLCLALAVGCKDKTEPLSVEQGEEPPVVQEYTEPVVYGINPLTGLEDISPDKVNQRPVAVTINNLDLAQPVQTGLNKADIIYETEVEGGITRLVALFQEPAKAEKIGSVRSARYAFIDLALGHNAIYVHHGQDDYHAAPHLKDVDRLVLSTNNAGARISNGLKSEHTLYAYGGKLYEAIEKQGITTVNSSTDPWQTFADVSSPVTFETAANAVNVSFSNQYKTTFKYDAATGKYIRFFNGTERKDYNTKESVTVKNVFVLNTTIRTYPNCSDGYSHKQVMLDSGDGYYVSNGTYTPIKWSKGAATNKFTFTKADGTALTVNAGNSWVCISDSSRSVTFE